jgi:hypothetical protein
VEATKQKKKEERRKKPKPEEQEGMLDKQVIGMSDLDMY